MARTFHCSHDLIARQSRLIARQWLEIGVLTGATLCSMLYVRIGRESSPSAPPPDGRIDSSYYRATLIGKDDAPRSLDGKAIQIDLGGERVLEINLMHQAKDHLFMWSPAKRGDTHFNCVVFRPHCSNAFALELDRVALRSAAGESVAFSSTEAQP